MSIVEALNDHDFGDGPKTLSLFDARRLDHFSVWSYLFRRGEVHEAIARTRLLDSMHGRNVQQPAPWPDPDEEDDA
jgi:hypothetical protein